MIQDTVEPLEPLEPPVPTCKPFLQLKGRHLIFTSISRILLVLTATILILSMPQMSAAQRIPHGQDQLPNPPRSPQEAVEKMTVPDGFRVELVASEPDIVNPVAMTFDERGRVWITESVEYPRRTPGRGRDRIKILEDTDGDGRADKFTIFADGLNIPSGIAVGHGGVWVANSPDLLFMRDTDGDDKVDQTQVVVTGFGRADTHELPNSLTWGPDGWLYGLNGVFNPSRIDHCGREHRFTCAMFRVHPRPIETGPWKGKRRFEVFCEGTSNPWGIAFNNEGSAFISACVIDHLWHLTETGYYHRQGGPYPPFTWRIDSIVKHRHQKAAYCGLNFFDSDAYPAEFREKLYMGNIHGGCINVDRLSRAGSTYFAEAEPDFLTANDSWFMPVAQKTGPDGCLYVLDWYDRYHCYQDANRDPDGIDRLKGRLYRIRYKDSPRTTNFDLRNESNDQLIQRLHNPNKYFRDIAQRLLVERLHSVGRDSLQKQLEQLALDGHAPRKPQMHAIWALIGGGPLRPEFHMRLLQHHDSSFRAWGVRAAGNQVEITDHIRTGLSDLAGDPAPDVLLQLAIASRKISGLDPLPLLITILAADKGDKLLPRIVWQNLHPYLEKRCDELLTIIESNGFQNRQSVVDLMPRLTDRVLASDKPDAIALARLFHLLIQSKQTEAATGCLKALAENMQTGQVTATQVTQLRQQLEPALKKILDRDYNHPLFADAAMVAATWNDSNAIRAASDLIQSPVSDTRKINALNALIASEPSMAVSAFVSILSNPGRHSLNLRRQATGNIGRVNDPQIAEIVLADFAAQEPALQTAAVELLTQRASWSKALFDAIDQGKIAKGMVNLTQIRKLAASGNVDLVNGVERIWGKVRVDRDPQRAVVINRVRRLVHKNITNADLTNGRKIYEKKCAICHMLHGKGEKVGPDITNNGRASFEQLLSNVLDPNLVIGADYQARVVLTLDGRFFTGLLDEENSRRVVLKLQGGKTETIARRDIDELKVSKISLMPENPEQDMSDQELVDLFAFIASDPVNGLPKQRKWIPGIRPLVPQNITDPSRYHEILDKFAPGFETDRVGELGLGIVAEHFGRELVLRTHPIDRQRACVLRKTIEVPAGMQTHLLLSVSYHDGSGQRDWRLVVKASGKVLHDSIIGKKTTIDGWSELSIDLSQFAGQSVELEIHNKANNWSWEFAYWDRIQVVSNQN